MAFDHIDTYFEMTKMTSDDQKASNTSQLQNDQISETPYIDNNEKMVAKKDEAIVTRNDDTPKRKR